MKIVPVPRTMIVSSLIAGTYAPPAVHEPMTTAICGMPRADICAWLKKIRPKWSRSGKTSAWRGRNAPPESTRYRHGRWFCAATSCARRCFFTVSGKYEPPLTVASFATITHSRPSTTPIPVTMPAPGACPSYMSHAASAFSSRNAESGSISRSIRSRAVSLPRSRCRASARSPPPCATSAVRSRSSATSSAIRSCRAAKASSRCACDVRTLTW